MTLDQFFFELKRIAPKFEWYYGYSNCIRAKGNLCPITAVANAKTGEYYPMVRYQNAAKSIGLSSQDARVIAGAADHADSAYHTTRRIVKRAVGLPVGEV